MVCNKLPIINERLLTSKNLTVPFRQDFYKDVNIFVMKLKQIKYAIKARQISRYEPIKVS